jgi:ATP-dependent exoDNAse (exonuclease V) alpha subunit
VACLWLQNGRQLTGQLLKCDNRIGQIGPKLRSFKALIPSDKREDRVAHAEIIAPTFAPEWVSDRAQLWNSVEANERRKDAQLSREFQIALPHELPLRLQRELLSGWVREQITPLGLIADAVIHRTPIGDEQNDHAHVMTTFRSIDTGGSWSKTKDRPTITQRKEQLEQWRSSWATHVNAALEKAGYDDRQIDHRSNARRGIEALPTIHVGYAAQGIEKRGGRSWRADLNRQIRQTNQRILAEIKARAIAAYRDLANKVAQKLATDQIGLELTPAAPTPAPKKQEPAPAPIAAKPQPTKPPEMPPPAISDVEAERKKVANRAAWHQHDGGGGVGG